MSYFRLLRRNLFKINTKLKTIELLIFDQFNKINEKFRDFLDFYDQKYELFDSKPTDKEISAELEQVK